MTIYNKQKLNMVVAVGFMLALAVVAVFFLHSISDKSQELANATEGQASRSLLSVQEIEDNLQRTVEVQKESLAQQREVERQILLLGERVDALSAEFNRVAQDMEETSRKVRIVSMKASDLNEVISDSVEDLSLAFEALPEGDVRFDLEDVCDELYDSQDLLQKEVILSLQGSSRSIDDFREKIASTASAMASLSQITHEQIAMVKVASDQSEETSLLANNAIKLTHSTVEDQSSVLARSKKTANELKASTKSSQVALIAVSVSAIIVLVFATCLIGRSIVKGLTALLDSLMHNKDDTIVSSDEVSRISGALASSSEQLARVSEETSAGVVEVRSMSEMNAQKAEEAKDHADEAVASTEEMFERMERLQSAMDEISASSSEIGGILSNIEDVAFQTNLLALNAAVEAARAGEAGAGFAVVADEVRALAIRSSEAAKKTAEVISRTQKLTEEGSNNCSIATTSLQGVLEKMGVMHESFGSIVSASAEQLQGMVSLSTSIRDVESLSTELKEKSQNASHASNSLNGQIENLDGQIAELELMLKGSRSGPNSSDADLDDFQVKDRSGVSELSLN
ncbi:methyl-accepting chemotaxis protein [Pelagicoccus albus]|uniref:Methyl-accepting transducer domain-containing protein n=1 Tax=Pelagicoccus albus TaxID=415222 RepID=A0A7X1B3V2_9BACT|nr:methyl-accepting chemotaxis protein [Pelagicoccus albus]MBC2604929.1 hypothetical protein [Pelagicoccus albus]